MTSVAFAIINYRQGLIVITGIELLKSVKSVGEHLVQGQYKEAAFASCKTMQNSLYFISVITPSPQLLALSLFVQVLLDSGQSIQEFKEGHYLERCAHLILGALHGHQLKGQVESIQKQYKEKIRTEPNEVTIEGIPENELTLTVSEIEQLLHSFKAYKAANSHVKFETFLKQHGYPTHLSGINFAVGLYASEENCPKEVDLFKGTDFTFVSFIYCNFGNLDLSLCTFQNLSLKNCMFKYVKFEKTFFNKYLIEKCNFERAYFLDSSFFDSQIIHSVFDFL